MAELEAQIAQAQADAQAQMKAANRRLIQSALVAEATAARFHKPEDAYRFVDMDALKVDDAGNVSGAKDAIKTLAKERSYLVNTRHRAQHQRWQRVSDQAGRTTGTA